MVGDDENGFNLVTSFDAEIQTDYRDYVAPFRGLMRNMKKQGETWKAIGETIAAFYKVDPKLKILAAASGLYVTQEVIRTMQLAIEKLGVTATDVDAIPDSPWVILTLESRDMIKTLVDQKAVFDPVKKRVIVFRKPQMRISKERVFEVKNVLKPNDLDELRTALIKEGAQVRDSQVIDTLS